MSGHAAWKLKGKTAIEDDRHNKKKSFTYDPDGRQHTVTGAGEGSSPSDYRANPNPSSSSGERRPNLGYRANSEPNWVDKYQHSWKSSTDTSQKWKTDWFDSESNREHTASGTTRRTSSKNSEYDPWDEPPVTRERLASGKRESVVTYEDYDLDQDSWYRSSNNPWFDHEPGESTCADQSFSSPSVERKRLPRRPKEKDAPKSLFGKAKTMVSAVMKSKITAAHVSEKAAPKDLGDNFVGIGDTRNTVDPFAVDLDNSTSDDMPEEVQEDTEQRDDWEHLASGMLVVESESDLDEPDDVRSAREALGMSQEEAIEYTVEELAQQIFNEVLNKAEHEASNTRSAASLIRLLEQILSFTKTRPKLAKTTAKIEAMLKLEIPDDPTGWMQYKVCQDTFFPLSIEALKLMSGVNSLNSLTHDEARRIRSARVL